MRKIKKGKYDCYILTFRSNHINSLGNNFSGRSFRSLSVFFKITSDFLSVCSRFNPDKVVKVIEFSTGYCMSPSYTTPSDVIVWKEKRP